jgi:hypothetical protein
VRGLGETIDEIIPVISAHGVMARCERQVRAKFTMPSASIARALIRSTCSVMDRASSREANLLLKDYRRLKSKSCQSML